MCNEIVRPYHDRNSDNNRRDILQYCTPLWTSYWVHWFTLYIVTCWHHHILMQSEDINTSLKVLACSRRNDIHSLCYKWMIQFWPKKKHWWFNYFIQLIIADVALGSNKKQNLFWKRILLMSSPRHSLIILNKETFSYPMNWLNILRERQCIGNDNYSFFGCWGHLLTKSFRQLSAFAKWLTCTRERIIIVLW